MKRDELEAELVQTVKELFIAGSDVFDYSTVDDNIEYDDLVLLNQDAQDAYFDSD